MIYVDYLTNISSSIQAFFLPLMSQSDAFVSDEPFGWKLFDLLPSIVTLKLAKPQKK